MPQVSLTVNGKPSTVEVEGRSKPGFVVRWRQLWTPEPDGQGTSPAAGANRTRLVSRPLPGPRRMPARAFALPAVGVAGGGGAGADLTP